MNDTLDIPVLALGPLAMVGIGWLLLWAGTARSTDDDWTVTVLLKAGGAVFLITGFCLAIIVNAHVFSVLLLIASVIIACSSLTKFYVAERQSLLWVLAVAAERGIPLESAARAFAGERSDVIGRRATLLADYLEAGVPLALALARAGCNVTPAVQLAAELGQRTGTLGTVMRHATSGLDEGETTLRTMIEKLFYLIFLVVLGTMVVTFSMLKVMPVILKIFADFGLEPPPLTRQLNSVFEVLASGWVGVPLFTLALAVFVATVICYVGVSTRQFPVISRLWWSADCSLVLKWLAVAVRQDLPLGDMVRLLAAHFPQPRVRRRLERASMRIDRGQNWHDSLQSTGIFRPREAGLFKSAERAGNLAWALDEMAESGMRRAAFRIRAWTNVMFPVVVCVFGAIVLFICLGSFLPLVALIQSLA